MARTLLTVSLLLSACLPAYAEDWLTALRTRVTSLDKVFEAPDAAEIEQVDLFGKPFKLSELEGRVVLLSFLDRDSVREAIEWLERQTTWMLKQKQVSFVNVFHPGGISFLIPRPKVVVRLRREVRGAERHFRKGLPPKQRAELEAADIRWVVDWKRSHADKYPVERGRVNVFLLDEQGRIREVHRYDPSQPRAGIRAGVEALLAGRLKGSGAGEDL